LKLFIKSSVRGVEIVNSYQLIIRFRTFCISVYLIVKVFNFPEEKIFFYCS